MPKPGQSISVSPVVAGLVATILAAPPTSAAIAAETGEAIRVAVATAVEPHLASLRKEAIVEIEVGTIDPRLRLPACPKLEVTAPALTAAMMTVKVDCPTSSWTIYVPVHLHAWVDAVVASANLPPNTKLDAGDMTRGRIDMFASNGGLLRDMAMAEGKVLRVGLLAGSPILSPFLEFPIVVHRGQKVLLTLSASTMTIKTPTVALEDGHVGDYIEVENPDSKKTMRATVVSDGSVEMRF